MTYPCLFVPIDQENVGNVLRIVENARASIALNDPNRSTIPQFG